MRVEGHAVNDESFRLWGENWALEVTAPLPGVLRVRHAPNNRFASPLHPQLPEKHSWAVVAGERRPLRVSRSGEGWLVEADGAALAVDAAANWTFSAGDGRELARSRGFGGSFTAGQPGSPYASHLELAAPVGEAYLGFGEKVGPLDKRGMSLTFWNTDVIPHHPDTDPLYQSIPFFVGLREGVAWGGFLDESWRSQVDVALAERDTVSWEARGPELDLYLFTGPGVLDVVRRYTELTGRMPLPPLWSLGVQQSRWGYASDDDILGVVRGYRERNLPLDCVYLDIDYMEAYKVFTWDKTRYPDARRLADQARELGVRLVTIVDPGVKKEPGYGVYDEAAREGHLVLTGRGDVLVGEVWPRPAVFPDFTRPEVREWWGKLHSFYLESGISGIWNDMNEPANQAVQLLDGTFSKDAGREGMGKVEGPTLPYDARHGRRTHLEVHNVYALGMARGTFEGLRKLQPERRPFVLTRAGFAGIQRYSAVWTGDNSSHWTHLEQSIPMLVGLGLSGAAFCGSDIPGFAGRPTPEMLVRWTQAGVYYPLMRNHAVMDSPLQEPWRFGEPYLSLCREALERRYRLLPTLYTLMWEAARGGAPVMRPLIGLEPGSLEALGAFDQFLFGPDLLVAPVVRPGQTARLAYLPGGEWLEFPNLESAGEVLAGGRHVAASAPVSVTPAWLRRGGAVALTSPAPHTTTANWRDLTWHVHAGPDVAGVLYEDDGDGYGASRVTRLSGGLDGGTFTLRREAEGDLPSARLEETVALHGLGPVQSVEGAVSHEAFGGSITVRVAADWSELTLRLRAGQ